MWIFTNYGFVSAVQHNKKKDVLLVRAREPGALEAFAKRHGIKAKVEKTPTADYLYRAEFKKDDFAEAVADEVRRIDYGNFKNSFLAAVPENTTVSHWALMDVWCVMRDLQQNLELSAMNSLSDFAVVRVAKAKRQPKPRKPGRKAARKAK